MPLRSCWQRSQTGESLFGCLADSRADESIFKETQGVGRESGHVCHLMMYTHSCCA